VVSLVAAGGTGKTALAERVLADLDDRPPAGVLVWSFYEDQRIEGLLRTACEYFTGETPTSAGGLLERLQVALAGDEPHLLVIDGLERVQAEGTAGRLRGNLEDPQLRRLVRWLAAGLGTRTRALVTSRLPLADLSDWQDAGHREERLDDLEPAAAVAVLRSWGVKGDDAILDGRAKDLGYHALSVAVLGSYLGKLWGGDPTKAPTFDRGEMSADDPKAARLTRILTHYAERLPDAERDLLARLSTFPRGVTAESLSFLIDAGGQIAGALAGCSQVRLLRLLKQLRELGLVFRYDVPQGAVFTAHPFLREHFRTLLGSTNPEAIHEAVRSRLATSLDPAPTLKPTDPRTLDRYEALIEHTRLAGHSRDAFNLYRFGLGSYTHLGEVLGDNARGLRLVSGFSADGSLEGAGLDLPERDRSILLNSWGLFAECLGDLAVARRAFALGATLRERAGEVNYPGVMTINLCEVELMACRLPTVRDTATRAIGEARWRKRTGHVASNPHAYLAAAMFRMGQYSHFWVEFAASAAVAGDGSQFVLRHILEAECRLALGDRAGAAALCRQDVDTCRRNNWTYRRFVNEVLLGLLALPDNPTSARQYLEAARNYASRSSDVEVQLRCYHLAAELARTEGALEVSCREAEVGLHHADTCGFGHYGIELRLALARAQLAGGESQCALQRAREALDRSVHPECQYAWGEADALDLCGRAHARLGEPELARQRLTAAVAARERLGHPGLADTRAALAALASG
jgi:hypothetical protein